MTESIEPIPSTERRAQAHAGPRVAPRPPGGLLGAMRIRKKLIFLHTFFSIGLATILLVSLRPAVARIVDRAEVDEATMLLQGLLRFVEGGGSAETFAGSVTSRGDGEGTSLRIGSAVDVGLSDAGADHARGAGREAVRPEPGARPVTLVVRLPDEAGAERFAVATTRIAAAREAVSHLFLLLVIALLTAYALVAVALEVFVLPQHVYDPIRRMREADAAVREGRRGQELIPDDAMPRDELGDIMRSRNESIRELREHETALADALAEIERVATDLKRKNHLLERARQNLRDADRLASLGMMSAGIAHELNTPLAVLKGLVEKVHSRPREGMDPAQAALMLRVVQRLERLGESLLDFARVRPPMMRRVALRALVDEAVTLVRLNREAGDIEIENAVPAGMDLDCDGDRMVQVLVNLARNAVDAMRRGRGVARPALAGDPPPPNGPVLPGARHLGRVAIAASEQHREGEAPGAWVSITVTDDGPGIDPDILPRLFEPFASTTLDARGTGLGLAVSEGIVREHGGVLLAKNRADGRSGAVFEIVMPQGSPERDGTRE